jgi:hypothetical protein
VWPRVRRDYRVKSKSIKAIGRARGLSRNTVRKIVRSEDTAFAYERKAQPLPRLEQLEALLAANETKPRRQRLTWMRMHETLRASGYQGGYDSVRRSARALAQGTRVAAWPGVHPAVVRPGRGLSVRLEPRSGCATAGCS